MAGPSRKIVASLSAEARRVRPTHLVAEPGDERTLCGLHYRRDGQAAYPQMWAAKVDETQRGHEVAGRPFVICPACQAAR